MKKSKKDHDIRNQLQIMLANIEILEIELPNSEIVAELSRAIVKTVELFEVGE